jgi:RNA polymerase sigma factor (sigma-70 family)
MEFTMLYQARAEIKTKPDEADDLIVRARSGDDDAFASIFRLHSRFVYKFIYAMLIDKSSAEELTQETFFAAYKSIGGLRGDASLKTWLCAIAKNVVYKSFRARRKEGTDCGEPVESLTAAADEKNQTNEIANGKIKLMKLRRKSYERKLVFSGRRCRLV